MSEIFRTNLKKIKIELSPKQEQQFDQYYELLVEWNKVMNLTGITEYEEVNLKHFLDSVSIVKVLDLDDYSSLIDIGTGAGFPGIPLKIIFPHLKIVLLDSLNKRVKFLNIVIETLGLKDITAIHGRAEEFAQDQQYREQFDLCASRAVANLSTLSEYCIPYVRIGGMFVSYKSGEIDEELEHCSSAITTLGGKVKSVDKFELPGSDISRSFVQIQKEKQTAKKYPRKSGLPAKKPL